MILARVDGVIVTRAGLQDAFVVKLSADGSRLVNCTYLGGSGEDHGDLRANVHDGFLWSLAPIVVFPPLPRSTGGEGSRTIPKCNPSSTSSTSPRQPSAN